ncbi:TPA: Ig-like domain-containing protein [Vibrio parahaemolyticus]|uniref:Ig-like domain-containing protein n=1 Tax=Vibrio campbellii TaxID=680 RepID=UPI001F084FB9|nr:Ig-like domain-containing protein [Vibrio campbellii]UMM06659.1 Ig-like domain-containing protein [Vibrio campbellii]
MKTYKTFLVLMGAAIVGTHAQAEVLSVEYTDMNNVSEELPVSNKYINPKSDITVQVSGGLDRRLVVKLNTNTGITTQTITSEVIGVNDRISSLNRDYYGKTFTLKKPADGTYELVAEIINLSGDVVQTDRYPLVVDTTPPTIGDPEAKSYGGLDGYNLPPDVWYTGYYSHNKYFASNVEDENSGIASVNAIVREGNRIHKHAKATFDAQAKQAHIGHGKSWFPGGDNATRVFGLQFEAIDKAGNKGYSKNQLTYYDTVGGNEELYAVYDPDSTSVMGGQKGYVPYVAGMTVKSNPIKIMYRIPKSNYSDFSRGGISAVGASTVLKDVDSEYVYAIYSRPYGFNDNNHVRFTDRRSWVTDTISYNLKLADSAPKAPVRKGNQYQYSDIGWSSWSRHVNAEELPVKVLASKGIVEVRPYDQIYNHMGTCTIPAGKTSCTITYNPPKELKKGTYGNLHDGSSFKNIDGSLYSQPGWASVHWNGSEIPSVTKTEWDPSTKKVTVYAHQPNRGYYFDKVRITDAYLESNNIRLPAMRTKWEENGTNYKFEFDLTPVPEGTYDVVAVVKENHNNYGRAPVVSFTNDSTPPTISLSYKNKPIGDMIQGISGLTVEANDSTAMTLVDAQLSGGPASDTVFLAFSKTGEDSWKLEQPRIFPALQDNEEYTLTVRIKDEFDNIGIAKANFKYTPENWLKLEGLKTLPVGVKLLFRNDQPVALVTSSELRTDSGNLATGIQDATVTLRKDAPYSVFIEGHSIAPGQTKTIQFDLGTQGGKLHIPIYPASNVTEGNAEFMIEVPQLKSIYDK